MGSLWETAGMGLGWGRRATTLGCSAADPTGDPGSTPGLQSQMTSRMRKYPARKRPTGIVQSKCWPCTGHPHNPTPRLRALPTPPELREVTGSRGGAEFPLLPHPAAASGWMRAGSGSGLNILAELVIPPWNSVLGKGSCNKHLICQLFREGPTEPTQFSLNPFTAISFY